MKDEFTRMIDLLLCIILKSLPFSRFSFVGCLPFLLNVLFVKLFYLYLDERRLLKIHTISYL